jgi:hypothetical protein
MSNETTAPRRRRRAAGGPVDAIPPSAPSATQRTPVPGGRRQRRAEEAARAAAGTAGEVPARMTAEQAAAARDELAVQVREHAAALAARQQEDPLAIDPVVLAQQQALAQRAAALNRQAGDLQHGSTEQEQPGSYRNDPTAPENLAVVAPVLKTPTTSIPLAVPAASTLNRGPDADIRRPGAEAEPVLAARAYGLDPLDAATAGLARLKRERLVRFGILALGGTALVAGMLMIFVA